MATLADVLRQTGYSQNGTLAAPATDSPMTKALSEHIKTLPQQLATNQAALDSAIGSWNKTDFATGLPNPNYRPEAIQELTQLMPNVMGSTRKEVLLQNFNKIAGGEKPVRSAVVLIGDDLFTGNTHAQAFQKAIENGVVRKEGGKYIYPKGAEINSDLFMLNDGRIVDRLEASRMLDVPASESAIKANKMQMRPANQMSVDEYMKQAEEIKNAKAI